MHLLSFFYFFFLLLLVFHKPKQQKDKEKCRSINGVVWIISNDATSNGSKHNDVMKKKCLKKEKENRK